MLGESIRRRRHLDQDTRPPAGPAPRIRWERWILSGLASVALSFGAGYMVAAQVLFPPPEAPPDDANTVQVPELVGKELTAAQGQIEALGLAVGRVRWLPHPDEAAGTVLAQDPLPGQRLRGGSEVRLAVSSGRAQARVPDVIGLPFDAATQLAERMGFEVNRRMQTHAGPAGYVLDVQPRVGTERVLPASITLIVSTPPRVVLDSVTVPVETFETPTGPTIVPPPPGTGGNDGTGH